MTQGVIMQEFGSVWTEKKLDVFESYLAAYMKIMQKQPFKLLYLDAFSGSGSILTKDQQVLVGSAVRALKFSFDHYYFFESNKQCCAALKKTLAANFSEKLSMITIANQDCNMLLKMIDTQNWREQKWRGVAFLDPYAMDLNWESLEHLAKTEMLDVWYLFPFMALNRNLRKDAEILEATQRRVTQLLGDEEWKQYIYPEAVQQAIFGETEFEKIDMDGLKNYIIKRLKTIFPTVSEKAVILRNGRSSPIFLLCFMGSNPSPPARGASLRVANYLLDHIEGA